jgi:excisionase family DNA binding protein
MPDDREELLTPEQVAERLQASRKTVYRWIGAGDLPAIKLGRSWRVPWGEVLAMVKRQSGAGEEAESGGKDDG